PGPRAGRQPARPARRARGAGGAGRRAAPLAHRRGPARTAAPVGPRPPDHAHRLDGHRGADRDGPGRGAGRMTRVSAAWLGLREPADAAARAAELVEPVRRRLAVTPRAG